MDLVSFTAKYMSAHPYDKVTLSICSEDHINCTL